MKLAAAPYVPPDFTVITPLYPGLPLSPMEMYPLPDDAVFVTVPPDISKHTSPLSLSALKPTRMYLASVSVPPRWQNLVVAFLASASTMFHVTSQSPPSL